MPAVAEVQFKATNSQTVVTAFNSVGSAAQNASTKIGQFTAAATTKVQQFTSSLKSIKSQGDPFANLTNNLGSFNKSVDQSSQKATSFGQKLKGFGSQFGSSIASIGTLGGTILNLSRQYQDLGDSQIAVDKAQLKVSKTTEATGAAQDKLNALTAKGVTSGAEYNKALLDVNQAMEAQSLAQQMLTERQEDHQRAQENFWIGLVPTVTSAGASIISVLTEIGGTKGLGGLKTALGGVKPAFDGLKTAFSGLTGIGGIATGLTGIGNAAGGSVTGLNGMTKATTGLGTAMKGLALSSLPVAVAIGGIAVITKESGIVIHEITSIMKGDLLSAITSLEDLVNLFKTLGAVAGPMGAGFQALSNLKFGPKNISMADEVARIKKELETLPPAIHAVDPALQGLDNTTQGINKTIDSLMGGVLGLVQKANTVPPAANATSQSLDGIGTAASTAVPAVTGLNKELGVMKFPTADAAKFDTYIMNWGSQTLPKATMSAKAFTEAMTTSAQKAQEHAAASLQLQGVFNSMGGTLTTLQSLMQGTGAAEQNWVAQTQASIATENIHRATLLKLIVGLGQHGASLAQSTDMLELEARAALGDAQAIKQLSEARKKDTAAAIANSRVIGVKVKGYEPGKVTGGPKYVTVRNGKVIGYGPGTAPPQRTPGVGYPTKQHGYQSTVHRPTLFIAGEGGRSEDITVRPRGSVQRGGSSGGGFNGTINVYVDGVLRPARYDMGARK